MNSMNHTERLFACAESLDNPVNEWDRTLEGKRSEIIQLVFVIRHGGIKKKPGPMGMFKQP